MLSPAQEQYEPREVWRLIVARYEWRYEVQAPTTSSCISGTRARPFR